MWSLSLVYVAAHVSTQYDCCISLFHRRCLESIFLDQPAKGDRARIRSCILCCEPVSEWTAARLGSGYGWPLFVPKSESS